MRKENKNDKKINLFNHKNLLQKFSFALQVKLVSIYNLRLYIWFRGAITTSSPEDLKILGPALDARGLEAEVELQLLIAAWMKNSKYVNSVGSWLARLSSSRYNNKTSRAKILSR